MALPPENNYRDPCMPQDIPPGSDSLIWT